LTFPSSTVVQTVGSDPILRPGRRWLWACLAVFGSAGLLLRFGLAVLWPTMHRPDELFQNLEPAHRLWTGWGIVTWEWREGIRSWFYPDILYGIMQATSLLHWPQDWAVPAVWAVMSALSIGVVVVGVELGWRRSGVVGAVLCGTLCAFWPDLVYFGPKTLVEVQAGNLLIIAAGLAGVDAIGGKRRLPWRMAAIGLTLGLAFALRFQLALALGLVALWAARADWRRWLPLVGGAAIPLVLLGIIDFVTWGSPFQSIWKNVQVNFFEGRANTYGAQPAAWYAVELARRYGAALLPLMVLFVIGARRAPLLALLAAVVVGFHSLITHKEISFIYAALPPAIVVAGLGSARLIEAVPGLLRAPLPTRTVTVAVTAAWCLVLLLTGLASAPYDESMMMASLRTAWNNVRARPDMCGLGLYGRLFPFPWAYTSGYSGLNRSVPIYLILGPDELARSKTGFNYLLARTADIPELQDYDVVRCKWDMCVLHRDQPCETVPELEINNVNARTGY